jgi:sugar phosphate isomerase/epimerase
LSREVGVPLSLSTGSLYHLPLATTFALARDAGLAGVELVIGPELLLRGSGYVRALAEQHGLRLLTVHPPVLPLPGWRRLSQVAEKLAWWTLALGAPLAVLHSPRTASLASAKGCHYVAAVAACHQALARGGALLTIENRARFSPQEPPGALDDPQALGDFVAAQQMAVTLDTAHAAGMGLDPRVAFQRLGSAVRNIHLSDVRARSFFSGRLFRGVYGASIFQQHQLPGTGTIPLAEFLGSLGRAGYCGVLTLELSPLALRAWSLGNIRRCLAQSVAFCRQHLA